LEEIPAEVKKKLEFVFVKGADKAIRAALVSNPMSDSRKRTGRKKTRGKKKTKN